jgi:hypothetical protein
VKTAAIFILMAIPAIVWCNGDDMSTNIQQVKAKYESELMRQPGVVSVGIGQDSSGRKVIVVGLEKAETKSAASIPESLDGYSVRVETVGPIKAQ